jgi:hypothetical protein
MKASSAAWAETKGNPTIAAEANRLPPIKRNLNILSSREMLASPHSSPGRLSRRFSDGQDWPSTLDKWAFTRNKACIDLLLARVLHGATWSRDAAPALREGGQRDGNDQRRAVEQGFDKERSTELLDSGNADGED